MTNSRRCLQQFEADVSQISSAKFHSWFTLLALTITRQGRFTRQEAGQFPRGGRNMYGHYFKEKKACIYLVQVHSLIDYGG